ncbi:hypothetical protein OG948_48215 (plasmid) [Embleya sp. NBC_00888]|uniref:hypothetical protein n=1 Tax=Embleya sp. NBC_00888 TaxID=2975960 RepID=UPI002F91B0AF|nr:hypothetical protein OG948_48215 [Embleya sp. NBC_00888]
MSQPQGPPTGSPRTRLAKATPPEVDNAYLRNIVADTYPTPGGAGNWVGNGKAAAALYAELHDGRPTGSPGREKFHPVDVADLLGRYRKALRQPQLSNRDKSIILAESGELYRALQVRDTAGGVTAWLNANPERANTTLNAVESVKAEPELASVTGSRFLTSTFKRPALEAVVPDMGLIAHLRRTLARPEPQNLDAEAARIAAKGMGRAASLIETARGSEALRPAPGRTGGPAVSNDATRKRGRNGPEVDP